MSAKVSPMDEEVVRGLDEDDHQEPSTRLVLRTEQKTDVPISFVVPVKHAMFSDFLSTVLKSCSNTEEIALDPSNFYIKIPPMESSPIRLNTASLVLHYVVQYLTEVRPITLRNWEQEKLESKNQQWTEKKPTKPLISNNLVENGFPPNEVDFVDRVYQTYRPDGSKIGVRTLFSVLTAANYMSIAPLTELCCAKVASIIKGQPLEKQKELLEPEPYTQDD